jgi:uncharacterized protein (TIGR00251 family)
MTDLAAGRVDIRVVPRASSNAVDGLRDGRLIIRVTAPPVDGKATAAAISTLADALGIARSRIAVVSGQTSRNKTVAIAGLTAAQVVSQLVSAPDRAGGPSESRQTGPPPTGSRQPRSR